MHCARSSPSSSVVKVWRRGSAALSSLVFRFPEEVFTIWPWFCLLQRLLSMWTAVCRVHIRCPLWVDWKTSTTQVISCLWAVDSKRQTRSLQVRNFSSFICLQNGNRLFKSLFFVRKLTRRTYFRTRHFQSYMPVFLLNNPQMVRVLWLGLQSISLCTETCWQQNLQTVMIKMMSSGSKCSLLHIFRAECND